MKVLFVGEITYVWTFTLGNYPPKKGAADAKRGQVFTRLAREIVIAAREGGGDAGSNFRLQLGDRSRPSAKYAQG